MEGNKSSSLKNLKSSNKSVLTVKATKYKNGNVYSTEIMAYTKKAGTATVSFKAGGKNYKVKVRAYKTVSGKKYYGTYSATKTAKVK